MTPVYLLDKPRVLAIRSQPVDLVPGGAVVLDALVYLPQGSPSPQYSWSWCASLGGSSEGYACSITAAQLTEMMDPDGGLGLSIDYSLGSEPTATFGYPASPDALKRLCSRSSLDGGMADASEDASTGDGGPGVGADFCRDPITVTVLLTVQVSDQSLQAMRTLNLYLNPPTATNSNPEIDGLTVPAADVGTSDGGPLPDGAVGLLANVPASASEQYVGAGPGAPGDGGVEPPTDDGGFYEDTGDGGRQDFQREPRYEGLSLAWYVEAGQLGKSTTTLDLVRVGEARDWKLLLQNWWTPPQAGGSGTQYEFILVLRDSREGIGWLVQKAGNQ